jgi:hypothetical protein
MVRSCGEHIAMKRYKVYWLNQARCIEADRVEIYGGELCFFDNNNNCLGVWEYWDKYEQDS